MDRIPSLAGGRDPTRVKTSRLEGIKKLFRGGFHFRIGNLGVGLDRRHHEITVMIDVDGLLEGRCVIDRHDDRDVQTDGDRGLCFNDMHRSGQKIDNGVGLAFLQSGSLRRISNPRDSFVEDGLQPVLPGHIGDDASGDLAVRRLRVKKRDPLRLQILRRKPEFEVEQFRRRKAMENVHCIAAE